MRHNLVVVLTGADLVSILQDAGALSSRGKLPQPGAPMSAAVVPGWQGPRVMLEWEIEEVA
jgi:hypothetical protein